MLTVKEAVRKHPVILQSEQSCYAAIREGLLPAGVVVRFGRKVLINEAKLEQFIDNGGAALPGGWKREAA